MEIAPKGVKNLLVDDNFLTDVHEVYRNDSKGRKVETIFIKLEAYFNQNSIEARFVHGIHRAQVFNCF